MMPENWNLKIEHQEADDNGPTTELVPETSPTAALDAVRRCWADAGNDVLPSSLTTVNAADGRYVGLVPDYYTDDLHATYDTGAGFGGAWQDGYQTGTSPDTYHQHRVTALSPVT